MASEGTWVPKSPDLSALFPADLDSTENHLPEAEASSAFHFQAQVPTPNKLHAEPPQTLALSYYGPNIFTSPPSISRTVQYISAPSPVRATYIPPTTPRQHQFLPQSQPGNSHAHALHHPHTVPQSPSGLAFVAAAVPTTPYRDNYQPPASYHRRPSADLGQYPLSPCSQKSQLPPPVPVATPAPRRKSTQPAPNLYDSSPLVHSPTNLVTPTTAMPPCKSQTERGSPTGAIEPSPVKTKFPTARIKRIMQADEEVGKVAQQTPIAVGKALEMFMIALVLESADIAMDRGQKRVSAQMLKQAVEADDQWDFLREIVTKVENEDRPGRGKAKAESDSDEDSEPKKRRGGRRKRASADD